MVGEIRAGHESQWAAMSKVGEVLGVGTSETVRMWCCQVQVDAGQWLGMVAELKRLKRENAKLKWANAILRSASVFFAAELDRPQRYIDQHVGVRDGDGLRWGVESVCVQLTELGAKIVPETFYEHRGRPATKREVRDEELKPRIAAVHAENDGVFGAWKVW